MQVIKLNANEGHGLKKHRRIFHPKWLVMKLTMLFLLSALFVHAAGNGQTITLNVKNEPLDKVLKAIQKQSSVHICTLFHLHNLSRLRD